MDIFVPIMFLAALLLGPILLLSGVWILVKKIRRRGWSSVVPSFAGWNRFWFTPSDPTVLGLMRICCGAVTTYTVFAYSFTLQDYMGEHAWYDLPLRLHWAKARINDPGRLDGRFYPFAEPANEKDKKYQQDYKKKWGAYPPPPFPINDKQADDLNYFRIMQGIDVRHFGLIPPIQDGTAQEVLQVSDPNRPRLAEYEKYLYVKEYMEHPANILKRPPPAYPSSIKEKDEIFDYMAKNSGVDPRLHFYTGQPVWSLWFDVTDPTAMMVVHVLCILVCFLFTIGFCTRLTSALTWITSLWYIHRSTIQLFGVDTMMMIVLLYLMIGPSGSALSVDRLIARWWSRAKPRVVNGWRALFGRPALALAAIQPAAYSATPVPSVSANFAIRMLQVHLCVIYLVSGLCKLQGGAWWSGTALWGTLANFEFAPMALQFNHVYVYNEILRWLAADKLRLEMFLSAGSWFTLAFEIGYIFFVWRPKGRRIFLVAAVLLHGGIALFMGLKTFALMMLVMNMSFLRREEVDRFLAWISFSTSPKTDVGPAEPTARPVLATAIKR
jgi:hypothetical protein